MFVTTAIERKCCFHFEKQMTQVLQGHPTVLSAVCNYGRRREALIAVLCPFYFIKKSFFGTDIIVSIAAWRLDSQCVCSPLVLFPSLKDASHTAAASHWKQISSGWVCKKSDFTAFSIQLAWSDLLAHRIHQERPGAGWRPRWLLLRIITFPSIKPSGARRPGNQCIWGKPMTRGLVDVTWSTSEKKNQLWMSNIRRISDCWGEWVPLPPACKPG